MLGPILRGETITLEPAKPADLPLFVRWFADTDVTRYLLARFALSPSQEEEWYESVARNDSTVHWAIVADGATIGVSGIHQIDWINRHAQTGTVIGERSQWGKGFGSEAVRLRTAFAFDELGLERLETHSLVENVGMHRALEKSGYRNIARRRHVHWRAGRWHDDFLFELLRDEWRQAVLGDRTDVNKDAVAHRRANPEGWRKT
jgi:[ribosomal protein S5]-alanine N-acetyltransferase